MYSVTFIVLPYLPGYPFNTTNRGIAVVVSLRWNIYTAEDSEGSFFKQLMYL